MDIVLLAIAMLVTWRHISKLKKSSKKPFLKQPRKQLAKAFAIFASINLLPIAHLIFVNIKIQACPIMGY